MLEYIKDKNYCNLLYSKFLKEILIYSPAYKQ